MPRSPQRSSGTAPARRRARRRRVAVLIVVAVVLATLVGGGVALAAGRTNDDRYRTATAALGSVTQRVDAVGTVSSAARRDAAFSVAGTVKKVDVKVGDEVSAGQELARLDPTDLQADVDSAKADLADAEQQLQDDLDSQTDTTTTSTGTSSTSTTASSASTSSTSTTASSATSAATVQDAVLDASTTPVVSSAVYVVPAGQTVRATTVADTTTTTDATDVDTALATVHDAQDALMAQYDAVTKDLTSSGDAVDSSAAACKTFLAVTDTSQAPSSGDNLTITPGTVAAGWAVKVAGSGVADADSVQIVLKSTGKVLTEFEPDGDSFTVGVVIPSGASGDDALQLVSDGKTLSSTSLTVTAAKDSAVADALATCQSAISDALDAQTGVDTGQQKLMSLAKDLDDAVTALSAAIDADGTTDGSTPTPTPTPSVTPTPTPTPSQQPTTPSGKPSDAGKTDAGKTDAGKTNAGKTGDGKSPTDQPTQSNPQGTGGSEPTTPKDGSTGGGTPGTSDGGSKTDSGGGGQTSTTKVATAADIVADRAAIDVAESKVDIAKGQLALVDLTSPIAGTVAAVSIAKGDTVSASSTTAVITVVGGDGYTVSTTVPLGSIDIVKVGQSADVTVRSTDEALTATVSSIGVLNVSTTSSTPSYAVDLAVDPTDVQLYDGSSAQVRIEVAGGAKVLTVPTSAVHMDGSTTTVQVLTGDTVKSVDVERGAVGSELTEITSGLKAGDKVVLADLQEPMDSGSDSSSSSGLSGLGGSSQDQQGGFQRSGGTAGQGGFGGGFGGGSGRG